MIAARSIALALLLGCASCVSTVAPAGGVPDSESRIVGDVEIAGNDEVSDGDIEGGLALRAPTGIFRVEQTQYDPLALELDRRRVVSYYNRRGFFSAAVEEVDTAQRPDGRVAITFRVEEGPRTTIKRMAVAGAAGLEGVDQDGLLEVAGLEIGDPVIYEDYEASVDLVRDHLVEHGYAFAKVDGQIEVDREDARAGVAYFLDPGPRVHFGKTIIEGNERVPDQPIEDRIAWDEGELFSPELLEETRNLLYELGYFSVVRFDMDQESESEVTDVVLSVRESSRHELKGGGGFGVDRTRWELRTRLGYTEKGFLLPLMTLRLEARPSYSFVRNASGANGLGGEASAGLDLDDFVAPRVQLSNLLAYSDQDFQAYSIRGPLYRISLRRPLFGDDLRLAAGWSIRYQTFHRIDEGVTAAQRDELGFEGRYRLGAFDQSVVWDRRDDPLDTSDGYYAELRLEEAGPYAGSAFEYVRAMPELRGYWSPVSRLVLASRLHYNRKIFGSDPLPITQRFFAGGASSHRGFSFQRLSPMIDSAENGTLPVGGDESLVTSVEARLDVYRLWDNWLGVAVFLDGGDVVRETGELDVGNLHWAAGLGLRYQTLIGPVRADIGYRLNRKGPTDPDPGNAFAFHISLGEAF